MNWENEWFEGRCRRGGGGGVGGGGEVIWKKVNS